MGRALAEHARVLVIVIAAVLFDKAIPTAAVPLDQCTDS